MKHARDTLVIGFQTACLFALISVSCSIDYRTDEEKANGVVLEEWVKENRAYGRREQMRLEDEAYKEKHWRDAYRDCGFANKPTIACL